MQSRIVVLLYWLLTKIVMVALAMRGLQSWTSFPSSISSSSENSLPRFSKGAAGSKKYSNTEVLKEEPGFLCTIILQIGSILPAEFGISLSEMWELSWGPNKGFSDYMGRKRKIIINILQALVYYRISPKYIMFLPFALLEYFYPPIFQCNTFIYDAN